MVPAHINGEILTWARSRAGVDLERLAKGSITVSKLKEWESGDAFPSQNQAMKLAQRLGISYAMLFMPSTPADSHPPIPDLRTVSGQLIKNPSLAFRDVLNTTLTRQDWIREERVELGAESLSFVGRYNLSNDPKKVATSMRRALGLSASERTNCPDFEAFIKHLVARAEDLGILVMRSAIVGNDTHRKLDVREFRGFALSDEIAPVIFINDSDAKAAQVFTLAHELAHIWIGADGVSDRKPNQQAESANRIELFCDQVAAELLVPEAEFTKIWTGSSVISAARATAKHFRVSTLVALRRAKDLHRISFDVFADAVDDEYARFRALDQKKRDKQKEKEKQGGNFWASFDIRNGKVLNAAVISALSSSRTSYTDASTILGLSIGSTLRYIKRVGGR